MAARKFQSETIRAFAPATVANVACGFDVFGMALEQPGDEVELTLNNSGEVRICAITGDNGLLPLEVHRNTAGVAITSLLRYLQENTGAEIILHKKLPSGSGMGSSASSAAAALVAANEALGNPLTRKDLIPFAMEAERVACGSAHADNVAPALLGGFVLVRDPAEPDLIEIPLPPDLYCVVVHPRTEIPTREARLALKQHVRLTDAVTQWANTAALIAGFFRQDYQLIARSLKDVVAEPVRSVFIPGFGSVREAALQAGALGCSISGSGPAIFALCKGSRCAENVAIEMQHAFLKAGLNSTPYISALPAPGASIITRTSD
ncbi:MAG: homoserine kinase [Cyclobacteriaceae bacterium]|nr:homoserine kinase [Cyclobacteriaceae bacterium]MCX7637134.1 homoserine kinase [Cyclobacteriaceae bacterium]MDW8330036.1 homoserine kinase [Cyclobacteriaceae bacterium]